MGRRRRRPGSVKLPSALNFTFRGRVVADPVQPAVIDFAGYGRPTCSVTARLRHGRARGRARVQLGTGRWASSNIWGCSDGATGARYHVEESLDRLTIRTVDGSVLAPEKLVRVEATVWATDPLVDALDLFVNADPTGSRRVLVLGAGRHAAPSAPGAQLLYAEFTLPYGGLRQAIRGVFRRGGAARSCARRRSSTTPTISSSPWTTPGSSRRSRRR